MKKSHKILSFALIIYILFFVFNVNAQQPTQEWVSFYNGPSNDLRGPYLQVDKLGNSYLAGTHVINDSINILVAKYNSSGAQQWEILYKYPGEGYFSPMALALDTLGNAYVVSKYGLDVLNPLNILTVKFNSGNGTVVWAKKYIGRYGNCIPEDIKIDKLSNIYVTGTADSALICIKYDSNGDSVWVRRYQPAGFSYGNYCTIDDSLNIIITGVKSHCVSFPPPGGCFDTILTVKYNSGGVLKWDKTYFYPGNTTFNAGLRITTDHSGSIYVGGKTRPNTGKYKFLTLKYDRNGILQWSSLYDGPGSGDDNFKEIAIDKIANSLYVTGENRVSSTLFYGIVIKYNTLTGDSIWVRRDTGSYSNTNFENITLDTFGNVYVAGSTYNIPPTQGALLTIKYSSSGNISWLAAYNLLGRITQLGIDMFNNVYECGIYDNGYILIKYSQPSGIQILSNGIPRNFVLSQNYPNPFNPSTKIKFSIPKKSYVQLRVFDVLGKAKEEIVNQELNPAVYEVSFDGAAYASGVYFYQLITDGKIIDTKKLILMK